MRATIFFPTDESGKMQPGGRDLVKETIGRGENGLRVEISLKYRRLLVQKLAKESLLSAKDHDVFRLDLIDGFFYKKIFVLVSLTACIRVQTGLPSRISSRRRLELLLLSVSRKHKDSSNDHLKSYHPNTPVAVCPPSFNALRKSYVEYLQGQRDHDDKRCVDFEPVHMGPIFCLLAQRWCGNAICR